MEEARQIVERDDRGASVGIDLDNKQAIVKGVTVKIHDFKRGDECWQIENVLFALLFGVGVMFKLLSPVHTVLYCDVLQLEY